MDKTKNVTAWRAVICSAGAVVLMIISQLAAFLIGSVPVVMGLPQAVGNVISAVLYPLFALLALKLLCKALLGVTLADCRITRYKIKPVWAAAAFIMPSIVVGGLLVTAGHWENPALDGGQISALVTQSVFLVGLAVGSVEEAVFRGVMMKALEMRWGKGVAVVISSVLFAAAHVLNGGLSAISFLQLLIAGSVVGVLFSLVTCESGSIWSAAFMHSIWNIFMASGILNVGDEAMENCIFNYVLETDSALITGGEFGAEASIVSIIAYLIFIAVAAVLLSKRRRNAVSVVLLTVIAIAAAGTVYFRTADITGVQTDGEKVFAAEIPENRFLILVNSKNSIPEGYEPELTEFANGEKVDSGIYPDLQKMFDEMRAEGIYPVVSEGYRTQNEQRQMMTDKIIAFENEGYSKKEAEKAAREYVAEVGTSEHELGFAVDINADKERSDNDEVYNWLWENAYKYGFILRYPEDKFLVTGISYEPWHYRYVGEYAEEIYKSGLCFEEWLEKGVN